MSDILTDVSPSALVHAIEANMFEFMLLLRGYPKVEVHHDKEMIWTLSDIPFPLFNVVLGAQLEPGRLDSSIEAAITRCKSRMVPMLWRIGPATTPADLGATLEAHGFTHADNTPGMAIELQFLSESIPMPAGLEIERVSGITNLDKWRHAFAGGFGLPNFAVEAIIEFLRSLGFNQRAPFHNYLGLLNGKPVAVSSVLLGASVAGIYNVATLPEARRRGIGACMTLAPLRDAKELGYRIGILHATEMGVNVYRKLGFQEYCTLEDYNWSP